MRHSGAVIAALVLIGGGIVAEGALAQSSLPWADANPLEGSSSHPRKPRPAKAREAAAPAAAEAPAPAPVPVPVPGDAADAPADVPVPKPDPRPAAEPSGAPAAADAAPAGEPGRPEPARPDAAEAKPTEEVPVPDPRPADVPPVPARPEPAPPEPAPPVPAPVEGKAGAEPAKPEDAPNSTEKLKSRAPAIDPATSVVAAAAVEDAEACEAELKKRGAVFAVEDSISEGECGVLRPVAIERLSSGVKVGPKTQMLCRTALALDVWMSDVVMPAARTSFPDRKLSEFRQASTYVCRPRASESGISEHARGSAIDIGAFVFDKGGDIGVAAQPAGTPEARFQDAVRVGACGPFKTVLGPGTDADHATHFHLDIAARRNDATYCK